MIRHLQPVSFPHRPAPYLLSLVWFVLAASAAYAQGSKQAQDATGTQYPTTSSQASDSAGTTSQEAVTTFKATTRIVVEEVLALNDYDQPLADLTVDDFQVFETREKSVQLPQTISSFRVVGSIRSPVPWAAALNLPAHRTHCAIQRIPPHFEISYYPSAEAAGEGLHHVLITTRRRHVRLLYRSDYFMTVAGPGNELDAGSRTKVDTQAAKPAVEIAKTAKPESQDNPADSPVIRAACDGPVSQPGPLKAAYSIKAERPDLLKYVLQFDAARFTFLPRGDAYQLSADYATCAKDANEHRLHQTQGGIEQILSAEEYQSALRHGIPFLMQMERPPSLAVYQIAMRDRETGKISTVNIWYGQAAAPGVPAVPAASASNAESENFGNLYFGSPVPNPAALCGELYLLQNNPAVTLPRFSGLDSVGALYATQLNVPDQVFAGGVPYIRNQLAWFGLDYRGTFWVEGPGEYRFSLESDDGSRLFIDDKRVIDNDGMHQVRWAEGGINLSRGEHDIRVEYFQGIPISVALVLRVKPPGRKWMIFDTRDFARPTRQ